MTKAGNQPLSDKILYRHAASGAYKLQLLPCDDSRIKAAKLVNRFATCGFSAQKGLTFVGDMV